LPDQLRARALENNGLRPSVRINSLNSIPDFGDLTRKIAKKSVTGGPS
jgi:hypothetical protein